MKLSTYCSALITIDTGDSHYYFRDAPATNLTKISIFQDEKHLILKIFI